MERKSFSLGEIKALGDAETPGTFEAVVAVFGNVDYGGDRIQRGAFKRSLGEWSRKGRSVPVLWSHDAEQVPIGVLREASETREGLHVKAQLLVDDHPQARAVYAAMKAGALHEFSFGYGVRDKATVVEHGKEIRVLKDLDLAEVSPVFRGMNPATRLMGVKSAEIPGEIDRIDAEIAALEAKKADLEAAKAVAETSTELHEETEPPPAEGAEPEDKPDPKAQAEEDQARIRALLAEKPLHIQESDQ